MQDTFKGVLLKWYDECKKCLIPKSEYYSILEWNVFLPVVPGNIKSKRELSKWVALSIKLNSEYKMYLIWKSKYYNILLSNIYFW